MEDLASRCYQPFYCEENVWRLGEEARFREHSRWALFISNADKRCAVWHQRAGSERGFVVWDYHVILLAQAPDGAGVAAWDQDCVLGMPLPLDSYLDASFPELSDADAHFRPQFRLVAWDDLLERFSSDRRHMRLDDGSYRVPPPGWPAPRGRAAEAHTLSRFVDMRDDIAGECLDLAQLRRRFASGV